MFRSVDDAHAAARADADAAAGCAEGSAGAAGDVEQGLVLLRGSFQAEGNE